MASQNIVSPTKRGPHTLKQSIHIDKRKNIYIYIYMKHDAVNWATHRLKKKKFGHYLILKNVFQKYCGANISSTVKLNGFGKKVSYIFSYGEQKRPKTA